MSDFHFPTGADESAEVLSYDALQELVREQVEALRGVRRTSETQAALDRAAVIALEEGEVHLASAILLLSSHRIAGVHHLANQALMQQAVDLDLPERVRPGRGGGG